MFDYEVHFQLYFLKAYVAKSWGGTSRKRFRFPYQIVFSPPQMYTQEGSISVLFKNS